MENEKLAGLMVEVIGVDCTNRGVTSGVRHAVLVGPGIDRIFAARNDMPALEIEITDDNQERVLAGRALKVGYPMLLKGRSNGMFSGSQLRVVRALAKPAGKPSGIFGGHYIETSDSRFPFTTPIPVFDRYE